MRRLAGVLSLATIGLGVLGVAPASAHHGSADQASPNMFHVFQKKMGGVNTDLAFWNNLLVAGNYNGYSLFDITRPEAPVLLRTVGCRGPQGDVSFYQAKDRLLLFVSVDTPQTTPGPEPGKADCTSQDSVEAEGWEGIRIWDVTVPAQPKFVTAVRTDCGSHTHTTIPDDDEQRAIIYVSSYPLAATGLGPRCGPPNDSPDVRATRAPHGKISIIEVPDDNPAAAHVLKEQPLHIDTDAVPGPVEPPIPGADDDLPAPTVVGCHDITVLTEANQSPEGNPRPRAELAAAACLTEGQIWDISDPANPKTLDEDGHAHLDNPFVEFWHSAAWTYDGSVVLFGDEHGGGQGFGCGGHQDPTGNVWFYRALPLPEEPQLLGRYHIPRQQAVPPQECSMHNFNVVPVTDNKAYIGVSSSYKGGTTVFDFSLAKGAKPALTPADAPELGVEIGFYDAQSKAPDEGGGQADTWSTYWYNDFMWANDGLGTLRVPPTDNRGLDVFKLLLEPGQSVPSATTTPPSPQARQFRARKFHHLNPQTQEVFTAQGG